LKRYHVIGLLSGSSLDGTDLAYCRFDVDTSSAQFLVDWELIESITIPYSQEWTSRLKSLPAASAKELVLADTALGHYYGTLIRNFIEKNSIAPCDLISSHGHTIYHFPESRTTTQIGDGAAIVSETNLDTITQLRSMDLAFGGQGAPLAPLGDKFLFPGYDLYLNLGGISNITHLTDGRVVAFDISTCNQLLNGLAQQLGFEYDRDGMIASKGKLNNELMTLLQSDEYLKMQFPRSLDNSWCQLKHVIPAKEMNAPVEDKLYTSVEFIAREIANAIQSLSVKSTASMFCTGGGALNTYLMQRIKHYNPHIELRIPTKDIVEFKEASFIALAGLWRYLCIPNLFSSVTALLDIISLKN
jgi:anhydro-N-acetylmuramic acid kinase